MFEHKTALLRLAKSLGLFALCRRLTRDRLRVLCYHGIWRKHEAANPFNFLFMSSERFSSRLSLLKRRGYPVLSLDRALERLEEGMLTKASVVITIDDGWYGTFRDMVPVLNAYRFPATIYFYTFYAETQTAVFPVALTYLLLKAPIRHCDAAMRLPVQLRDYLASSSNTSYDLDDHEQREDLHKVICELAEDGMAAEEREQFLEQLAEELGCDWQSERSERQFHLMSMGDAGQCGDEIDFQLHTHHHRSFHNGTICLQEEIQANRERLRLISKAEKTHFCYPSGEWNEEYFPHLAAAGVESATTTDVGLCSQTHARFALPRILDGEDVSEIEFEAELAGVMEIKRAVMRYLRQLSGKADRGSARTSHST